MIYVAKTCDRFRDFRVFEGFDFWVTRFGRLLLNNVPQCPGTLPESHFSQILVGFLQEIIHWQNFKIFRWVLNRPENAFNKFDEFYDFTCFFGYFSTNLIYYLLSHPSPSLASLRAIWQSGYSGTSHLGIFVSLGVESYLEPIRCISKFNNDEIYGNGGQVFIGRSNARLQGRFRVSQKGRSQERFTESQGISEGTRCPRSSMGVPESLRDPQMRFHVSQKMTGAFQEC